MGAYAFLGALADQEPALERCQLALDYPADEAVGGNVGSSRFLMHD